MHFNSHEVTTKDVSGVHRGISRKLNDWFSSVCLGWPHGSAHKNNCTMYLELNAACGSAGNEACTLCAAELTSLNSFQKPQQPS